MVVNFGYIIMFHLQEFGGTLQELQFKDGNNIQCLLTNMLSVLFELGHQ